MADTVLTRETEVQKYYEICTECYFLKPVPEEESDQWPEGVTPDHECGDCYTYILVTFYKGTFCFLLRSPKTPPLDT
jgi:hypothetical protein